MTLYARRNDNGVSVNESAICEGCMQNPESLVASFQAWAVADDVSSPDSQDSALYPVDNPDALCVG